MNNITLHPFFQDIKTKFKNNKEISGDDLTDLINKFHNKNDKYIPNNLKTAKKLELLDDYRDSSMNEEEFVGLLRCQTIGADYINFDYIVEYYGLETDDNDMIIFTHEFPFDSEINKEALFIWGILNMVKNDIFLSVYMDKIEEELQTKFTIGLLNNKYGPKFDLCFKNLNMVIEIDEDHKGDKVLDNDKNKTAMLKLNGYNLTRLNFQKIHSGKIVTNINDIMKNNRYYGEFLGELKHKILTALLSNYPISRESYIKAQFINTLKSNVSSYKNKTKKIHDTIAFMQHSGTTFDDIESYNNYHRQIELNKRNLIINYDLCMYNTNLLNQILNPTESTDSFHKLFELKTKCRNSDYGKVITFDDILELFNKYDDDVDEIVITMHKIGIIDYDDNAANIKISWKDLSELIYKYDKTKELCDVIHAYYSEVEEHYEKIIRMIETHNDSICGDEISYQTNMRYILEKKTQELTIIEQELKEKSKMVSGLIMEKTNPTQQIKSLEQKNALLESNVDDYQHRLELKPIITRPSNDIDDNFNLDAITSEVSAMYEETHRLSILTPAEFAKKMGWDFRDIGTDKEIYISDEDNNILSDSDLDDI